MTSALLLAGPAAASDLDALLRDAGAIRHVASWPETNVAARESAEASLDAEAFARLMREVHAVFAAEPLLERVVAALAASLAPESVASLRQGFDASGAAGLLGPPEGLSAPALRAFPRFASRVSRQEVPPARFRLVAKLDAATGVGRDAWRVSAAVGHAILRGAAALRCEADPWRAPLAGEASERAQLAGPFQERLHVELLFLTREHDVPDLRRAVRFLETAPARRFHQDLAASISVALETGTGSLRERLAPAVAERCP